MTPAEASLPPSDPPRRWRRWRWLPGALLAALVLLAALSLSLSPSIAEPRAPDAQSVTAAKGVLKKLGSKDSRRGTRLTLSLSQRELDGLAQMGSEAFAPLRIEARLVAGTRPGDLVVRMSRQLPLGAWINVTAVASNQGTAAAPGLPHVALKIGRVPVPQTIAYWVLERLWLRAQGDDPAPLALTDVFRRVTITPSAIRLAVVHPGRDAAMAGLAQARGSEIDGDAVAAAYCALAAGKDADLAALVRRAGALPVRQDVSQADHNRALLTAIAMRAVPEYRLRLGSAAVVRTGRCDAGATELTLAGREDLAKHWAVSAALTASLGSQVARSMGTWKELADSTKGGSGFSFVDLAADRSGERFAIAAVDPQLARPVHVRLGAITDEQLLPRALLSRPEGLDQQAFERDYSATSSPEYARALLAINRLLDNAGVP